MRVTKPGTILYYDDILVEVIGIAEGKTIIMRPLKAEPCSHCGSFGDMSVLEGCMNWEGSAKPVPTLTE